MKNRETKTSQDIHKLEGRIRDLINSPRKQYQLLKNANLWSQLCSCLDIIGDTELAIAAHVQKEFHQNTGAYYLAVYGVLQALFLQQDALFHLCESLGIKDSINNYLRLKEIREDRNASIGHPTKLERGKGKEKRISYHFISRISLSNNGFDLASFDDEGHMTFRSIHIPVLVSDQHTYASQILSTIITKLEQEEASYKEQFKMDKLCAAFPETLGYYLQKVLEWTRNGESAEFGAVNLKMVVHALQDFQAALEHRGLGLDTYDAVQDAYDLLAYPIAELDAFFQHLIEGKTPKMNGKAAYIFAFFIREQFKKLQEIASEIDEECC